MTDLTDLLAPGAVLHRVRAATKKAALDMLAKTAGDALGLQPRDVLDAVLERERLGGTGVGDGVAIPHARLRGLDRVAGLFARLDPAHDFEGPDGRPCDLVFMLLAPLDAGADHLRALARVSRALRRPDVREKLRAAATDKAILALLGPGPAQVSAA